MASPRGRAGPGLPDRLRGLLPDWLVLIRRWRRAHGVFPRLRRPVTFNEKILHRMIFDRRAIFTELADKAAVRAFVQQRLGPDVLPRLYHLTTDPADIPFDTLPDKFVVKPTHGSGWVQLVTDKATLDRKALVRTCLDWLDQSFYGQTLEWHYKAIPPRILVEAFIEDGHAGAPDDFKFFVFDGVVRMIEFDTGRPDNHRRRLFTPGWERIDARLVYDDVIADPPPPPHLAQMIAAARVLAEGLDFVRVDFYDTPTGFYFGEFTMMPGRGLRRFQPEAFDGDLGRLWTLPARRWRD